MMNCIRFEPLGSILSVGYDPTLNVSEINGELPADFMDTFALGKYCAVPDVNGIATIQAVPGWVPPELPAGI